MTHDFSLFERQLGSLFPLDDGDRAAIFALPFTVRCVSQPTLLARQGEGSGDVFILLNGFALRHRHTVLGGRQISALNIAGDILNISAMFLKSLDYNVLLLPRSEVAVIAKEAVIALLDGRQSISKAVTISALIDASITREWLINQSRRSARARVAHFFCEHALRMETRSLVIGRGIEIGVNQEQLADIVGLTPVHTNRTLRALEADGLIHRLGRRYEIINRAALVAEADFRTQYLFS